MSLEIHHRQREGIEILDLKGRLTIGDGDLLFREELQRLVAAEKYKVIVNLRDVSRIDSTGLGALILARTTLLNPGGRLALANLQLSHLETFLVMKLELVLDIYEDEISAVNSFFPDREVRHVDVLSLVEYLRKKPAPSETAEQKK